MRIPWTLASLLLVIGCDNDTLSSREDVTCEDEGTVCSESDGECHCGSEEGPICGEEETCDAGSAA